MEASILFAQEGANVLLVDINLEAAERVAALIAQRSPHVKALPTRADVGKEADVKAAVDRAVALYIQGLDDWIIANAEWSFETERYFGKEGHTVKKTRQIALLPQRARA